jgi:hypothetical protein
MHRSAMTHVNGALGKDEEDVEDVSEYGEFGRIEKVAPKIRTSASVGGAIFRDETVPRSGAGQESGCSGKEIC